MKYILTYEKFDMSKLNSFLDDIDELDLDQQQEITKKAEELVRKKQVNIRAKKKEVANQGYLKKNKKIIDEITYILDNTYLKEIETKYNLRKERDNFKFTRSYSNEFKKKSLRALNSKIENHADINIDSIKFSYKPKDFKGWRYIELTINQLYAYYEITYEIISFSSAEVNEDFRNRLDDIKSFFGVSKEGLDKRLEIFEEICDRIDLDSEMKKYNL